MVSINRRFFVKNPVKIWERYSKRFTRESHGKKKSHMIFFEPLPMGVSGGVVQLFHALVNGKKMAKSVSSKV